MTDNTIKVITPNIVASSKNSFCLSAQNTADEIKIGAVKRPGNDKYVITSKNGGIPDIELDEQVIDLLVEARRKKHLAEDIVLQCRDIKDIDDSMLDDTNAMLHAIQLIPAYPIGMSTAACLRIISKTDKSVHQYIVSED